MIITLIEEVKHEYNNYLLSPAEKLYYVKLHQYCYLTCAKKAQNTTSLAILRIHLLLRFQTLNTTLNQHSLHIII